MRMETSMEHRDYQDRHVATSALLDLAANQHAEEKAIEQASEMLEGIEAIVISIADRVDRLQSVVTTLVEEAQRARRERLREGMRA